MRDDLLIRRGGFQFTVEESEASPGMFTVYLDRWAMGVNPTALSWIAGREPAIAFVRALDLSALKPDYRIGTPLLPTTEISQKVFESFPGEIIQMEEAHA